ncbi:MAG: ArsA family ATPase [Caldiserica bacterium]|nr:MAG: ArsA family ATPase [Caldisericota bacterium]
MRILLFTGKGGVGKTSISAATALRTSELGYRTLIISTDSAHSLSDSFDVNLFADEPVKIKKNLYAQEISPEKEIKKNWQVIQNYLSTILSFQGLEDVISDEITVLPGMEELFSLMKIKEYYESKSYDVVVIDCAPTGSTLQLLSFPDVSRWYMKNIFPVSKRIVKTIRPMVVKYFTSLPPFPDDDIYESVEEIYERISDTKEILSDGTKTSIRLVLNPEKMVIKETQRTFTYLNLYGFSVDCVIANRIIPVEVEDSYFENWKRKQADYIREIEECFSPLPVFKVKLFNQEITGLKLLEKMAQSIYEKNDPTRIFYQGKPVEIKKMNKKYILSLTLPFVGKKEVNLLRRGNELIITTGKFKRNILLPYTLASLRVVEAEFKNNKLEIEFGGGDSDGEQKKRKDCMGKLSNFSTYQSKVKEKGNF